MVCPQCGRTYDDDVRFCSSDGSALMNGDEDTMMDTMMGSVSEATMVGNEAVPSPPPAQIAIRVRDQSQPRDLRIGDMVGGYRLDKLLGTGGMATVYRGVNPMTSKQVAIKVLHPKLPTESEAVARFMQEARAINQIGHRNIIDIIQFDQLPDGRQFLVMELLQGMSLQRYLAEKKVIPARKAVTIIKAIASALDAAHAKGFIHRDLKPENVLLERVESDEHMLVKLLDFGAAKYLTPEEGEEDEEAQLQTKTGIILGTPDYMSPEQCDGAPLDKRTDVYSLGVVAFQCLTGQLPFQGENFFEVMSKRLTHPPPIPSQLVNFLGTAFDAPLLTALQRQPEQRFQRAGELAHALEVAMFEQASAAGNISAEELAALTPRAAVPSVQLEAVAKRTAAMQALHAHAPSPSGLVPSVPAAAAAQPPTHATAASRAAPVQPAPAQAVPIQAAPVQPAPESAAPSKSQFNTMLIVAAAVLVVGAIALFVL